MACGLAAGIRWALSRSLSVAASTKREFMARAVSGLAGGAMAWIGPEATGTFWISALAILGSAVAFYWIMTAVGKWAGDSKPKSP
jgi:hypothetical protein